jgi:hypothetical protein
MTANSGISGDRAFWQLKIALNVAAIGCRGAEEATLVSAYNNIIKAHAKQIRSTEKTVIADLGKETRTNGIAARDKLSTQLFNYFAQPPAQRAFCARANEVAQLVSSTPSAQVIPQAPYAKYQADVAAWDAKYAPPPPVMTAPATTAVSGPSGAPVGGN